MPQIQLIKLYFWTENISLRQRSNDFSAVGLGRPPQRKRIWEQAGPSQTKPAVQIHLRSAHTHSPSEITWTSLSLHLHFHSHPPTCVFHRDEVWFIWAWMKGAGSSWITRASKEQHALWFISKSFQIKPFVIQHVKMLLLFGKQRISRLLQQTIASMKLCCVSSQTVRALVALC